ncbi:origin recognition complex subunit 3 [Lepisosteus oculatus]|uniref:origin recognition complex subunit 3 n=1 Tax=Lepisosteus oculatus TaxID=7918 RepID=UPI0035F52115
MATSSVSKGCFVFKPSSKKRRRTLSIEDYFQNDNIDPETSTLRFQTCQSLWEQMKTEVEVFQEELNKKILDRLLEFARKSTATSRSTADDWASRMRSSEIPTAALVLGVNVPDHDVTLRRLSELLQQSATPFVVSLQSKECSALKQMVQKVLLQLMGCTVSLDEEEEEQPALSEAADLPRKRAHCSLATLCDWYQAVQKKAAVPSPCKSRGSPGDGVGQGPPVVVIFKDFESFNPRVLQDFIIICSQYIQKLPLTFVFGIATSPITIHHVLPHSVSSLLCIELFQSVPCTEHLAMVIDKLVLTTQFPLKLSGKVLRVLIGIFLYHDFSVRNFIKGLQLALLEHFYNSPLSVLCCKKREALSRAQQLSHENCEGVRRLPSFMRYIENQEPQEQIELLTNDQHLKDVCQRLLRDLHTYHKQYYPVLRCLHTLTATLPKHPLGKQIRELHVTCLERNVWECEEYASALQLLRILAKDELVAALRQCSGILESVKSKELRCVSEQLNDFIGRFEQLDKDRSAEGECTEEGEDASPRPRLQKKTDLFHLQKTLLEMKESRRTKKLSRFEVLRNEALDFIETLVKKHLVPPEAQALHEVCYYSSHGTVRCRLNAAPRTSIQTALSSPYCYLQNDALKSEEGAISNAAPDICIVYKLHLECGRLINLYDWLEAYRTVVAAAEGKDRDGTEAGTFDEEKHARFIRAVSELEFLGFVKNTKQKTDHVARLTWGGC